MVISSKLMTCVESRRWPRRKEEIASLPRRGEAFANYGKLVSIVSGEAGP